MPLSQTQWCSGHWTDPRRSESPGFSGTQCPAAQKLSPQS
uniref:Uncharacterized protein n=1 Tax=Anguilla anguilla TaxID=7936 RepID=A0A0E9TZM3_ANGAN